MTLNADEIRRREPIKDVDFANRGILASSHPWRPGTSIATARPPSLPLMYLPQ
jgi:hypothetical protein